MELVDLAVQAVDGTKVTANAALIQTYDAKRLQELLDRVESAIESLEAQNEGGRGRSGGASSRETGRAESTAAARQTGNEGTCRVWSVPIDTNVRHASI